MVGVVVSVRVAGGIRMASDDALTEGLPADSVVTRFRFRSQDDPEAIVIGRSHEPFFIYPGGRTEVVSPRSEDRPST